MITLFKLVERWFRIKGYRLSRKEKEKRNLKTGEWKLDKQLENMLEMHINV